MNLSIDEKIALITGASRGIGKEILTQLADQGAIVLGTATSERGAEKITEYIEENGFQGQGYVLNVAEQESINTLVSAIKTEYAMPDILVNNAGITRDNLMIRMKEDEWQDVINTNLTGIFRLTKACLKTMMKARWGRIISIGSVVGSMGTPGQSNYCAAKAGLQGFSKALAKEIGSRGITVNVVAPGFIQTDMTAILSDDYKAEMEKLIPLGECGRPEDIANAVGYLASEAARYITGETMHVNGGMWMS